MMSFKNQKRFKGLAWNGLIVFSILVGLFLLSPLFLVWNADQIHEESSEVPAGGEVAIVFGAGLNRYGRPSDVLADRLIVAAELYFAGKVETLLVSGDNSSTDYDEPTAMRDFLVEWGVPLEDIALDFAGRRTYDTCIRARTIWDIDQAVLVTQAFHLPRALFLCEHFGVESMGVSATLQDYRHSSYFYFREKLATYKAILDVYFLRPSYIGGEMEVL